VLSLRTGCPWRELPAVYGNANTLMSRYNRWKQDGTINRITAALGFENFRATMSAPFCASWPARLRSTW